MEQGLVGRILKFHSEYFRADFANAPVEFFEEDIIPDEFYTDDQVEGLFAEWFIFDYKLTNGRLVLDNYIKENFDDLPEKEIIACKNLLDNEFGFFLVKKVDKGKGLTLESMMRNKIYEVQEKNGTKTVSGNEVMVTRVARVDDHWEIISSEGFVFGKFTFDKNIIKRWQNDKHHKFTPKEFYWQFYKKTGNLDGDVNSVRGSEKDISKRDSTCINPAEAKENFEIFLRKYKLDQYLNTETVQGWFYDLGLKNSKSPFHSMSEVIFIFNSLMINQDVSDEFMNEAMVLLGNLHNTTPLKRLKGKTPKEMLDKESSETYKPKIEGEVREFSLEAVNNFNKATEFIKKDKLNKAENFIQKGFSELYKERLVFPEPYRVFINLANIYSIKDNLKGTEQLIDMTLGLNSNYSLGRTLKKDLEKVKKEIVNAERERQKVKTLTWEQLTSSRDRVLGKNSPALKYYNFLKKTKINFVTKELTKDRHKIIKKRKK
jgi:hypothetical protein